MNYTRLQWQSVIDALETHGLKPQRSGKGYKSLCPAHDDRDPSLSVTAKDDGGVLIHCFADCTPEAVVEALGMSMSDLFADGGSRAPGRLSESRGFGTGGGKPLQSWQFSTATGRTRLMHRKEEGKRWEPTEPKNDPPPKDLLYIPAPVIDDEVIILTEGASSCDHVRCHDIAAIGLPGAEPSTESLSRDTLPKQAHYIVWPDLDSSGHFQAVRNSRALMEAGYRVSFVDVPRLVQDPRHKFDAGDWKPRTDDPLAEILENVLSFSEYKDVSAQTEAEPLTIGLAEWQEKMRQPPDTELTPEAPGLLYARRLVVIHSNRGVGKSTYSAFAAARASRVGRVLLLVDDDPATWSTRLDDFDANKDNVQIGEMSRLGSQDELEKASEGCNAIVIDSWRRWLRAASYDKLRAGAANDESVVGPVIDRLANLAHSGPAVCLLTNEPKWGDTARGSFSLEDSADAVRRIAKEGDVTTISTPDKARVGIPKGPWKMKLAEGEGGFAPAGGGGGGKNGDPFAVNIPHAELRAALKGLVLNSPLGVSGAESERILKKQGFKRADIRTQRLKVLEFNPHKKWVLKDTSPNSPSLDPGELGEPSPKTRQKLANPSPTRAASSARPRQNTSPPSKESLGARGMASFFGEVKNSPSSPENSPSSPTVPPLAVPRKGDKPLPADEPLAGPTPATAPSTYHHPLDDLLAEPPELVGDFLVKRGAWSEAGFLSWLAIQQRVNEIAETRLKTVPKENR